MTLSVVIPTFNRADSLVSTLLSLAKQKDHDFDVLIIDGGSTDETSKLIARFKKKLHLTYIVDPTKHLSYIRDKAWRLTSGDIVASVDDDVIVDINWARAIKNSLSDSKIAGVTGPTVIPPDRIGMRDAFLFHTTTNPFLRLCAWLYFFLFMNGKRDEIGKVYPSGVWSPGSNFSSSLLLKKPLQVDHLEACNFAFRRSALEQVGGFDLHYTGTSEWCEMDLAFRIRKLGYVLVFNPKMATEHHVSQEGVYTRRYFWLERFSNFIRFYIKTYYPKTIMGYVYFSMYLSFLLLYFFVHSISRLLKRFKVLI